MSGKCIDRAVFPTIPDKYRFKAIVYDFDEEEKVVDVEMIDYKTGGIWHTGGFNSTNYMLIPMCDDPLAPPQPLTLEELRERDVHA